MTHAIIFGCYLLILLGILTYMTLFFVQIRRIESIPPWIHTLIRVYLISIAIIIIYGSYWIWMGDILPGLGSGVMRTNL